jgi:hypothetical protein
MARNKTKLSINNSPAYLITYNLITDVYEAWVRESGLFTYHYWLLAEDKDREVVLRDIEEYDYGG